MLHLIRAIWIKLKVITIKNLSFIIIITGYLLFILSMIEGFLGHLLCWGQMSYWGITGLSYIIHWFIYLLSNVNYIIGFPFSSSFGGFTGLISANRIIDTILHDSYFIIGILKEDGLLVILI